MRRNLERQAPSVWRKPALDEDEDNNEMVDTTTRSLASRHTRQLAITCRQGRVSERRFYAYAYFIWDSNGVAGGPQKCSLELDISKLNRFFPSSFRVKFKAEMYRYNLWEQRFPAAGQDFLNDHDEIVCKVYGRPRKGATWTCVRKPIIMGEKKEFTLDLANLTVDNGQACEQIRLEFVSCPLYSVSIHCVDLAHEDKQNKPPQEPPGLNYPAQCVWSPDSQAPFCGDRRFEKRCKRGRNREVRQLHRGRRYDLLGQDIYVEKREVDQ